MEFFPQRKRWTENDEGGDDLSGLPESEREVYIEKTHIPLFEFRRLHHKDHLLLNPQIGFAQKWSVPKKSRV